HHAEGFEHRSGPDESRRRDAGAPIWRRIDRKNLQRELAARARRDVGHRRLDSVLLRHNSLMARSAIIPTLRAGNEVFARVSNPEAPARPTVASSFETPASRFARLRAPQDEE